ncbi:hypothetical protein GCM10010293_53960 [Streptomyces griseoflavus]|nr:hypothetical protein GCM10010293_53960 [Streptomyces griseoflavus]
MAAQQSGDLLFRPLPGVMRIPAVWADRMRRCVDGPFGTQAERQGGDADRAASGGVVRTGGDAVRLRGRFAT